MFYISFVVILVGFRLLLTRAMDFLSFNSQFRVLICTRCQYALVPTALAAHLKAAHKAELTREDIQSCERICKTFAVQGPKLVQKLELPFDTPPIPHLRIYVDGIRCDLCPKSRPYICQGRKGMSDHLHSEHQWENPRGKRGRPSKAAMLQRPTSEKSQRARSFVRPSTVVTSSGSSKSPSRNQEAMPLV